MNRKDFGFICLAIIVVGLLALGVFWQRWAQDRAMNQVWNAATPVSSLPAATETSEMVTSPSSFSFSCPQMLTGYESKQIGVAFCYPSDVNVSTGSITWQGSSGTQVAQISFWILHVGDSSNVFGHLATCDASGPQGDYYCVRPTSTQIVEGRNPNGLNYVLLRHKILFGQDGDPNGSVYTENGGPSAFVPLIGQNYLAFAIVNSVYQPTGLGALPSYVDKDLLEILSTVKILPEQYTGFGLTLMRGASGSIEVYNVIANSPALAAGIKDGDIVTGINGTSTEDLSLDNVTGFLDGATGTIALEVQEGNGPTSTVIDLSPAMFMVSGSDLGAMYENPF